MGQSQGQGLGLGQLLPPSSSSSPAILVETPHQSEQKLDGAAPPTPDSVESLTTKLDDAVKPAGWDSSTTVESPTEKLEQQSDGDDICWGERRWGVKPTWWDHDVKPTGWDDGVRSDQAVKPPGWEVEERSDQDVKPPGWEVEERSDQDVKPPGWEVEERSDQGVKPPGWEVEERSDQAVKPTGWGDGLTSDQDVKPTGWEDVKPTGWEDGVRSHQDVKPTGWEVEERSDQGVKPPGWEFEERSDQAVKPPGWEDVKPTGRGDGLTSDQDVKPTGWEDVRPTGWEDGVRSHQDVKPTGWDDGVRSDQGVKPPGWEVEERSDQAVKPPGWEDVKPTGWEDGVRSHQDVKPTGWDDGVRSEMTLPNDVDCEKVKYPERPDRPDCSFYVATGSCKFGLNCRYNHPPQRNRRYKGKPKKRPESTQTGVCKVPMVVNTEERVLDLSTSAEAYQQSKNLKQMEKQDGKSEGNGCHDYPRPEGNSNPVELMPSKEGKSEAICFRQRVDKPDCSYFLKTGKCQFGSNCRFNHPSRGKVTTKNQSEPIKKYCKENMKESTSGKITKAEPKSSVSRGNKVGTTGKHAHFPVKTEPGPEELNFLGLPMRPGEMECNHFMRTGSCKFTTSCRYHHPNPVPVTEQDTLPEYQSGASPQQHASGASELPVTSFPLPIASCGPLPHPSPPYTPGFYSLPTEGFYPCPGWNGYQVPTTPWTPPEMISGNPSTSIMSNGYVPTHQAPLINEYPERPGQPVCQYFTRNGHCKFKSACKFHHPKPVHRVPSH